MQIVRIVVLARTDDGKTRQILTEESDEDAILTLLQAKSIEGVVMLTNELDGIDIIPDGESNKPES